MSSGGESGISGGQLQDFTIDQFAGAFALSMGAIGTLLLVVWQSRCLCKCRLGCSDSCYIFDCSREPPPIEIPPTPPTNKVDDDDDDDEDILPSQETVDIVNRV